MAQALTLRALTAALALISTGAIAAPLPDCHAGMEAQPPAPPAGEALHVFIDQTMPLTRHMKDKVVELLAEWGQPGETLKIVRFSANTRGQFMELMFEDRVDPDPDDFYIFNLRRKEKRAVLSCLETRRAEVRSGFMRTLRATLDMTSSRLPKTELLHSLNKLSRDIVQPGATSGNTVLLVTDGLENSPVASFHQGRTIKAIAPDKTLGTVKKNNLVGDWRNARVFVLGLGHVEHGETYVTPRLLEPLKTFWTDYFRAGSAGSVDIGTPMLLRSSLR